MRWTSAPTCTTSRLPAASFWWWPPCSLLSVGHKLAAKDPHALRLAAILWRLTPWYRSDQSARVGGDFWLAEWTDEASDAEDRGETLSDSDLDFYLNIYLAWWGGAPCITRG